MFGTKCTIFFLNLDTDTLFCSSIMSIPFGMCTPPMMNKLNDVHKFSNIFLICHVNLNFNFTFYLRFFIYYHPIIFHLYFIKF